jgi:hypothetical protein
MDVNMLEKISGWAGDGGRLPRGIREGSEAGFGEFLCVRITCVDRLVLIRFVWDK